MASVSCFAQEDKVKVMYDEYADLVETGLFEDAAKKMKKILSQKLTPENRIDYGMELASLYLDTLKNKKDGKRCLEDVHKQEKALRNYEVETAKVSQLMAAHYKLACLAENAKDYGKMLDISNCGLRLYDDLLSANIIQNDHRLVSPELHAMLTFCRAQAAGEKGNHVDAMVDFDTAQKILDQAISNPQKSDPNNYLLKWSINARQIQFATDVLKDKQKAMEVAKQMVPDIERAIRVDNASFRKQLEKQGPFYIYLIARACYEAGKHGECIQFCKDGLTWPDNEFVPLLKELQQKAK